MMKQIYTCVKRCFIFFMLCFISSIANASEMTEINELSYQSSKDSEFVADDKPDWQNAADSVTASEEEYARAIPTGYARIWDLNTDTKPNNYRTKINTLRPESAVTDNLNPVLNFQNSIPSQYNFVMRQTDRIRVAIPGSGPITSVGYQYYSYNGGQHLLDVTYKPNPNGFFKSAEFYLFNVGQIVEDSELKDVHAKVTLTVGNEWWYSNKNVLHLTFYDFTDMNSQPKYFLRLLRAYDTEETKEKVEAVYKAPVTIQYNFYTATEPIDWNQLSAVTIDPLDKNFEIPSESKSELENKGLLTYYTYKDINQIENAAHLTEVSVNGYWLFSNLYNTIGIDPLPGGKFTQLYADEKTTVLFSQSKLNANPPILNITGETAYNPTEQDKNKLVMTYEGNNFGYTYRGIPQGKLSETLGVYYSSDIPNKIDFSAPEWIETNYPTVSADDWGKLSYSFIQNIPYNSRTDIAKMTWTIPDPELPEGPFELGKEPEDWKIYNENKKDVTKEFFDIKFDTEKKQTIISTKKINDEFYNHNYIFSRKLTLKGDGKFSQRSKDKRKYVVESPEAPIQFLINNKEPLTSTQKPKIFDMNIQSTLNIQCLVGNTKIESDQCGEKEGYFLLDEITEDDIDIQPILATNNGEQYYTFESSDPKIPFVIESTKQELTLNYEESNEPLITIKVPEDLKFKPIELPLKSTNKTAISERIVGDEWQVEISDIPKSGSYIVDVDQAGPFSYIDDSENKHELSIENARVIFKPRQQAKQQETPKTPKCEETEETPCRIVSLHRDAFSKDKNNDGYYHTLWGENSGLLFQYTDTGQTLVFDEDEPYTATVTFTLSSAF